MSRITLLTILFIAALFTDIFAQSPQSFQYQAVVRDALGNPVLNQPVGVQCSILQGSMTGTSVYTETHSPATNAFGVVSLAVGNGTVQSGDFSQIDWAIGPYFLKVEIDPAGGTNYVDMGATQLLSVPYAMYAAQAGSAAGGLWDSTGVDIYNTNSGKVGVGTNAPPAKFVVQGDSTMADTIPLFEVKDRDGHTVFIVYPDSARLYVGDNNGTKTNKGAFAVSGRNTAKQPTHDFLWVTPDSTRIFTGDTVTGFAVENIVSGGTESYLKLTPQNYFIGHQSGDSITTGVFNSFFGYQAGMNTKTGYWNVFMGYQAGKANVSGQRNIYIGYLSGTSNQTGWNNTFIGNESGKTNTTGIDNLFIGHVAGRQNLTGQGNCFLGTGAGRDNAAGSWNTYIGLNAGSVSQSGHGVFIGSGSGFNNTTGEGNIFIGSFSGSLNTTGYSNIYVGYGAGMNNPSGVENVCVGKYAGSSSSGSRNVFIGNEAGGSETGSNKLYIDNSSTSTPLIYGDFFENKVTITDVLNLRPRNTFPVSPMNGDLFYHATDHHIYCYVNGAWKQLDN